MFVSPRRRSPRLLGILVATMAAGTVAACTAPTSVRVAQSTSNTRLTSVTPAGLGPDELTPPKPPKAPDICAEAALTTAQISALTKIPLADTPPVAPGAHKEMCVYGGMWSSPLSQFALLDDDIDPDSQVPTTTAPSTAKSSAPAPTQDNSISIGGWPLQSRPAATLDNIPKLLGPDSQCEHTTRPVTVPDLKDVAGNPEETSTSEEPTTSGSKPPTRAGIPSEAPGVATLDPTVTRENVNAGKRTEMDFVECVSTPTQSTPQLEIFFVGYGKIWEINAIVPAATSGSPTLDEQRSGLRTLAALLASR